MLAQRLSLCVALLTLLLGALAAADASQAAFLNELEHLWVDGSGYNAAGFKAGVSPCSFYDQGLQTSGRQSAAQWMRYAPVAFRYEC